MNDGALVDAADTTTYDLLVVIDEFAVGGVASLYSSIVAATTSRGLSVAVAGRDDDRHGLRPDRTRGPGRVAGLPGHAPLFLSLLSQARTSLVFHGSAGLTRAWFGEERLSGSSQRWPPGPR